MLGNISNENSSNILDPSSTPTPTPSQTPTPTSTPTLTPTPTPTLAIEISYTSSIKEYIIWELGPTLPDSGSTFLEVNMTVENMGYESFSTNLFYFNIIVDNIKYSVDSTTYLTDNWELVDVLDKGIYQGTLIFQIPESATSFTLGYNAFFPTYNIIWTEIL